MRRFEDASSRGTATPERTPASVYALWWSVFIGLASVTNAAGSARGWRPLESTGPVQATSYPIGVRIDAGTRLDRNVDSVPWAVPDESAG